MEKTINKKANWLTWNLDELMKYGKYLKIGSTARTVQFGNHLVIE